MGYAENKRQRHEMIEFRLMNTRAGLKPSELAQMLNVDRSTIHRDLQEISQRVAVIQEDDGRYRIDPSQYTRNVTLSNAEALTIYIALRRFIRQTSHAPSFFTTAVQKIAKALRHASLTEYLGMSSSLLDTERQASSEQTEVWNRLLQSWYEQVVVRLEYRPNRSGEWSVHEFEPYLFEPAVLSHGVYVIGWSRTRGQLRTLKIDRIRNVSLTAQFFERRDDITPDDLFRNAWGVWYGAERTHVVLRFDAAVADRVRETVWHPSQRIEEQPDGSLIWTVEVAGTLELVSWIRGWGHEVEVLEPLKLREEIIDSLRNAILRYE